MTIAYFDCFSGISGDMVLGALVDAGVGIDVLRAELEKLNLPGYEITALKVDRGGITSTRVHVCLDKAPQPARRRSDIRNILDASSLASSIKDQSMAMFERLAAAEAKVHGSTPDHVHFHEVGAVDAIVDIVGSVIGLDLLGITRVCASPVNFGSGTIESQHGILPVPAPATVELLKGVPAYGSSTPFELTTPTGAVILTSIASWFGPVPAMTIDRTGYGAGGRDIPGHQNALRLLIGQPAGKYESDDSVIIESNIDDMNPQVYDYLLEHLISHGARDAYLTPIIMKKGRPAILLSVLTDKATADDMVDAIFRETTSIGVRIREVGRRKLEREIRAVETAYGKVRIKVSKRGTEVLTATPEYEDCRRIAEEKKIPLKQVMDEAKIRFRA